MTFFIVFLLFVIFKGEAYKTAHTKVQKFSFPDQVITGERTSAACTAVSGTPPMEFKWFKNGQTIKSGQQFKMRTSTDYSILFIENVERTTSGNYTCELISASGTDRYTAILEVKESPKWIKEPKDTYITAGVNVSLECEASGFPIPDVIWKKSSLGGKDIYEDVSSQKTLPGKSIWTITHASTSDSGFYICIAQNSINTIQTNGIILSISAVKKPSFA